MLLFLTMLCLLSDLETSHYPCYKKCCKDFNNKLQRSEIAIVITVAKRIAFTEINMFADVAIYVDMRVCKQ